MVKNNYLYLFPVHELWTDFWSKNGFLINYFANTQGLKQERTCLTMCSCESKYRFVHNESVYSPDMGIAAFALLRDVFYTEVKDMVSKILLQGTLPKMINFAWLCPPPKLNK